MPPSRLVLVCALCIACSSGGRGSGGTGDGGGGDGARDLSPSGPTADLAAPTAHDLATPPDLSPPVAVPPVACGGGSCRVDQTCVAGSCQFPCTGKRVPGDYADLRTALAALAPTGGTICLGAGTHGTAGSQLYSNPQGSLTIIGQSAATTRIVGQFNVNDDSDRSRTAPVTVTLKGIAFTGGVQIITHAPFHDTYQIIASRIGGKVDNVSSPGMSLELNVNGTSSFLIDGDDFQCSGCTNMGMYPNGGSAGSGSVTIQNCFFHDSESGVEPIDDFYGTARVIGNTFYNLQEAMWGGGTSGLLFANNLFLSDNLSDGGYRSPGQHHHNGYFGTSRGAAMATGDVSGSAVGFDLSLMPPPPPMGSPLRGGADPALGPDHDFWGNPRGPSPDIGAVQHY